MTKLKSNHVNEKETSAPFNLLDIKEFAGGIETNRELIDELRELGIIRKDRIYPVQKYIDKGYFIVSDKIVKREIVSTIGLSNKGFKYVMNELGVQINFMNEAELEYDEYGDIISA